VRSLVKAIKATTHSERDHLSFAVYCNCSIPIILLDIEIVDVTIKQLYYSLKSRRYHYHKPILLMGWHEYVGKYM